MKNAAPCRGAAERKRSFRMHPEGPLFVCIFGCGTALIPRCAQSGAALCRPAPRSRTTWHPEAALTVQSAVHHHFLFGLAVPGHAQHLVFVALEMPVAARQNVVFERFHFHPRFRSFVHDVITKRIIAYFRAAKKPFAGKMRKKVCGGCLHCRAANAILKR